MSAEATATTNPVLPTAAAGLTQTAPGALPASYVETDQAQCGQAKIAHLLGIFGILGTGIFYAVKKNDAGTFAKDQMKEAFNFQLLVFCVQVALNILAAVTGAVLGAIAAVFSLLMLAVWVGGLVLLIMNAMKAGKGQVARYPARLNVLK